MLNTPSISSLTNLPPAVRDLAALPLAISVAALDVLAPTYIFLTGFYFLPLFLAI